MRIFALIIATTAAVVVAMIHINFASYFMQYTIFSKDPLSKSRKNSTLSVLLFWFVSFNAILCCCYTFFWLWIYFYSCCFLFCFKNIAYNWIDLFIFKAIVIINRTKKWWKKRLQSKLINKSMLFCSGNKTDFNISCRAALTLFPCHLIRWK